MGFIALHRNRDDDDFDDDNADDDGYCGKLRTLLVAAEADIGIDAIIRFRC